MDARFALTAEIELPPAKETGRALALAAELSGSVDAIQLGPAAGAAAAVSPLAFASLLLRQAVDPVPVLDCRDRNRIALQSDLLGLRALGVSSVVLEQGRQEAPPGEIASLPVFDITGRELIAMACAMNEENWGDGEHEFILGTRGTAAWAVPDREASELKARAAAGARFLQVRPCSDPGLLQCYLRQLIELKLTWAYSVTVSLPCPEDGNAESWAAGIRAIMSIRGVSGINLPVGRDPQTVRAAIEASGLRD